MAFYRCGGGGIPSSLKTDMNAVLNKKFGTSTTYDPSVWASTANLMGPLPERTATGSIAHITDGADEVPIKSWLVTLPASLSGYSAINGTKNTGTGTPETQYTVSLGRTIYGGTADVVNGTGTETAGKSVLDQTETWLFSSAWSKTNTNVFYTQATHDEISFSTWNDNSILLCDGTLPVGTRNEINNADANMIGVSGNVGHPCITVRIDKTTCPDLASFIQYITNNQISFVYKKATPETFTFTPITPTPETALGVNNFWSDSGDTKVTYRADINLALGGQ